MRDPSKFILLANIPGHPLTSEQAFNLVKSLLDLQPGRGLGWLPEWQAAMAKLFPVVTSFEHRRALSKEYPNTKFGWE